MLAAVGDEGGIERGGDLIEGGDDREVALWDKDRRPAARRLERSEGGIGGP